MKQSRRDFLRGLGAAAVGTAVPRVQAIDDRDARIAELEQVLDTEEQRADDWADAALELIDDNSTLAVQAAYWQEQYEQANAYFYDACYERDRLHMEMLELQSRYEQAKAHSVPCVVRQLSDEEKRQALEKTLEGLPDCPFEIQVQHGQCNSAEPEQGWTAWKGADGWIVEPLEMEEAADTCCTDEIWYNPETGESLEDAMARDCNA